MQKNILYVLLLIIVGAGVYYLVFSRNENVFGQSEAAFNIKDTGSIGKIFMVRTSGEAVTITRTDSGWMLNDKYRAHAATLASLMRALRTQEAQFPVPETAHNSVIKSLAGKSVKVEVYDRDGEKIRVFYVGGEAYNFSGTFMLLDGAKKPYQVNMPGLHGTLAPYYHTDIADWRDRSVFRLQPDEIRRIKVEYPHEPLNSFTIHNENNRLSVEVDPAIKSAKPLNEKKTSAYLGFYKNVNCEGFLMGLPEMANTLQTVPKVCIMDVTDRNGVTQHVEIFQMPINKRSRNINMEHDEYDSDRFYAVMNHFKDTAIIQRWSFENLWRRGFEFYEPEAPVNIMGVPTEKK